jgi:hypothetical protein
VNLGARNITGSLQLVLPVLVATVQGTAAGPVHSTTILLVRWNVQGGVSTTLEMAWNVGEGVQGGFRRLAHAPVIFTYPSTI